MRGRGRHHPFLRHDFGENHVISRITRFSYRRCHFRKSRDFQNHVIFRITQFQNHAISESRYFQNHAISESRNFRITLFSESRNFRITQFQNHVIFRITRFQNHAIFKITQFSKSRNFRITRFSTSMTSLEKFTYFLNLYNFQDIGYDFICVLLLFSTRCLWKTIKNILMGG